MPEIDLVVEEASGEFDALSSLVSFSTRGRLNGRTLAVRSRIVASDASVLFIAAAFEEGVRQLGTAYARQLCAKKNIPPDRMKALRSGLWERASSVLYTRQLGSKRFDLEVATQSISVLQNFCLDTTDMSLLVGHGVYNTRNMRTEELNALFKRLGINDICAKAGRSNDFKRFFTAQSVGAAESEFRQYLDKFYETRNAATHDLGLFRALGAVDLQRNIDFFKLAIFRVGEVLKQDILSVD